MPPLYGEESNGFCSLQDIMKKSTDTTLLTWDGSRFDNQERVLSLRSVTLRIHFERTQRHHIRSDSTHYGKKSSSATDLPHTASPARCRYRIRTRSSSPPCLFNFDDGHIRKFLRESLACKVLVHNAGSPIPLSLSRFVVIELGLCHQDEQPTDQSPYSSYTCMGDSQRRR
ncbi:hypothetical protein OH76DRAFT_1490262 [Lentinus brumalis]|uniref:Uncharacterized protein n=1 Tax=Lentinus brumalis TaxID=2498619 RepID=A0A371CJL5_9APHY|nr:hypothetical protein OH76DRAFT_1490262 [Polyporus brumalis]